MRAHECFHCKQWVEEGEAHDCWTTTEQALTEELSEELTEAWQRLRESAVELGDQRIYASHKSIMFARKSCYFFVRPKRTYLEVCIFLGRAVNAPQVRKVVAASKAKRAHIVHLRHRDEVEPPITDWLREAYEFNVAPAVARTRPARRRTAGKSKKQRARSPARAATPGNRRKTTRKTKRA